MDREPEELQFLGFFGIYHEAFKIINLRRKLFTKIALTLVLPLSFIFLAHIQISDAIFAKIDRNEEALDGQPAAGAAHDKILKNLSSEWTTFLLFKAAYLIMVLIFSLLSTSAVVYAIACIYSGKDMTYRRIMSVVPKVWKRLMATFLWMFVILLGYNFISILIIVMVLIILGYGIASLIVMIMVTILFCVGLVYISVIWHLASVISVLEDRYGLSAMEKSKDLIKGKLAVAVAVFIQLSLLYAGIQFLFGKLVVRREWSGGLGGAVASGLALVVVLCMWILLGLVIQTVVYFVCKSYHHENIDKSCLSDHLEVYLGEYVPLKDSAVQLEQFHV
ncbi:hypothetical protein EJ110_NYTH36090 [Nymphaea thermarum]|nr:hypothetical protein EJ110_NYTH36090 [Nymphaea thermarum]